MSESYHLFLVDHDEDITLLMRTCLERAGHDVTTRATAAEALTQLAQETYDLLILENHLPDTTGLDLLRTVQTKNLAIPALMVTAHGDEQLATHALQAGALDYLAKDAALTFLVDLPKRVDDSIRRHCLQQSNRLLEQQLAQAQKLKSIGTLAGGIAHEFNNLLAGVQGYANLALREANLPTVVRDYLCSIQDLTDRAAHLTRQLLTFARKPTLRRLPTRLDELLQAAAELLQRSLNIFVELHLSTTNTPPTTLADANQLQQVLINLALNARDAMSHHATMPPIQIRLSNNTETTALPAFPEPVPAGSYHVIEVRDSGTGMPPDVLRQAFDPFFTTKNVGEGTGLGLAVAFGIVRAHQGYLTIETEVGCGTEVRLWLPPVE